MIIPKVMNLLLSPGQQQRTSTDKTRWFSFSSLQPERARPAGGPEPGATGGLPQAGDRPLPPRGAGGPTQRLERPLPHQQTGPPPAAAAETEPGYRALAASAALISLVDTRSFSN